jgi:hypothetical protein
MTAILKVDTIQDTAGNNIINESSDTITIGASGDTIAIPSGGKLTAPGHVLQVIQANTGTEVTHSTSYADTGLSASITPSSTSNKVLVRIEQACFAGGDGGGAIKLMRDSTSIYTPAVNYAFYGDGSSLDLRNNHCYSFLDSPSSTSAITYKTQGRSYNSTVFKTQNDALKSFITLMEVAG